MRRSRHGLRIIPRHVRSVAGECSGKRSKDDGKEKKTIGRKYADFQISKFGTNAQPYYCLMDHNGNLLMKPRAYDLDKDAFVAFLKDGIKNFQEGTYYQHVID